MEEDKNLILRVEGLRKFFPLHRGVFGGVSKVVRAVDGVSFDIGRQESLGLVGESGSGKTTVGRTILRLIEPDGGGVSFEGEDVLQKDRKAMRELRKEMQIVFQDPVSSLNPRMTVERIIGEGLLLHRMVKSQKELRERVAFLLEQVGLSGEFGRRYPHEFSGGQRQRIGIARALAVEPKFIVADEPVSALDVSIQSQILNLLLDLQEKFKLSFLFIAHNLAVVEYFCDRVAVMYLGKIVELADAEELYRNPAHPYTKELLAAIPEPDPEKRMDKKAIRGETPSPVNPPSGCAFHPRCPSAGKGCEHESPELAAVEGNPRHLAACSCQFKKQIN
ncbi:MAG: oligopeptide/dipeptide ABC transporter ATP-binding protein [Phycisphaerae bacterium]